MGLPKEATSCKLWVGMIAMILGLAAVAGSAGAAEDIPTLIRVDLFDAGVQAIAVDSRGDVVMTGVFVDPTDFDPGPGVVLQASIPVAPPSWNAGDFYVLRLDADGALVWVRSLGGPNNRDVDEAFDVAIDTSGNVLLTGWFSHTADFDPGAAVFNMTSVRTAPPPRSYAWPSMDVFLVKLDRAGNFVWARHLGSSTHESGWTVATDTSGNVVSGGEFGGSIDFRPGTYSYRLTSAGQNDGYVWKLNSGGWFLWARRIGGSLGDAVNDVAVDAAGNVYATGYFSGTADFDPGTGVTSFTATWKDAFVWKLDSAGRLIWARQIADVGNGIGSKIVAAPDGSVYVTGSFRGTADLDPGPGTLVMTAEHDADSYVLKLDAAGALAWVIRFEEAGESLSLALDPSGGAVVTGAITGAGDFDPGPGTLDLHPSGGGSFTVRITEGGGLDWGFVGRDYTFELAIGPSGELYLAGMVKNVSDFDPGPAEYPVGPLTDHPSGSAYLTELSPTPDSPPVGLVDPTQGYWYLRQGSWSAGFFFGNPGDYPFTGDWDCDGIDTPGLYRQSDGYVYLRNSNTQGVADITFFFGNPGDIPLAGDFDGDGCDTVSIYRPSESTVYVIDRLGENGGGLGAAEFSFTFGSPGDVPVVGDFDGDGIDTVGLYRSSIGLLYYRNSHTPGIADNTFTFGANGDRPVAGDWDGDGTDTPAVFRPAVPGFLFRNTNTAGAADDRSIWGRSGWLPVSGTTWLSPGP